MTEPRCTYPDCPRLYGGCATVCTSNVRSEARANRMRALYDQAEPMNGKRPVHGEFETRETKP